MIFENTGLDGLKSDLAYLDESAEKVGFVRWQWEYYRATYDYKIEDELTKSEYFVRINTRVVDGKLEKPDSVLSVEAVYLGKATFPHGLDYDTTVPQPVVKLATQKLQQLKELLEA
ncbi:YugN-like family protein [Paenibacillus sp. ACRSA]|uniref:YugN family protein n=1 Tax=Paenibacillus sp. ACRSA TaxID=2918211 RepID=UPI001EF7467C|nr:YugN family protein [Paenibacillus sp. ACRSA]MCG7375805.1 YugN-like family protein [Paenibacillus sp. ACRSA]